MTAQPAQSEQAISPYRASRFGVYFCLDHHSSPQVVRPIFLIGHTQGEPMFEDLNPLRAKSTLLQLLTHYGRLAVPNRETWQDRLMDMEAVAHSELAKLHGELIACGWIDQNTGNTPVLRAGAVPACYRATLAGLRVLEQIQAPTMAVLEMASGPADEEKRLPKPSRRHREKNREALVALEA